MVAQQKTKRYHTGASVLLSCFASKSFSLIPCTITPSFVRFAKVTPLLYNICIHITFARSAPVTLNCAPFWLRLVPLESVPIHSITDLPNHFNPAPHFVIRPSPSWSLRAYLVSASFPQHLFCVSYPSLYPPFPLHTSPLAPPLFIQLPLHTQTYTPGFKLHLYCLFLWKIIWIHAVRWISIRSIRVIDRGPQLRCVWRTDSEAMGVHIMI